MENNEKGFNETMEEQIGNMGGGQPEDTGLKDFGKLRHVPGQPEELNEEEQSVLRHLSSYWPAAAEPMDFRQQADLSSFKSILALEKRGWIIRTAEGISLHPLIFRIIQYLYPAEDNN